MKQQAKNTLSGIATRLKELRAKTDLTQEELARRSGVGLRFVREVEQGKPTVRVDKVNQVLALFGYHLEAVKDRETSA
jgi:y4mF family transcriptional regulator